MARAAATPVSQARVTGPVLANLRAKVGGGGLYSRAVFGGIRATIDSMQLKNSLSLSAFMAGILATFVGFSSSFAIVVQGLQGVGASVAEAASGLLALSLAMGLCGVLLSWRTRLPVTVVWSTPGAAFLATLAPPAGGFAVAVGAFMVSAALVVAAGLWRPLGRAVSAIPAPLASAMLAGVLLPLCLAPFQAAVQFPALGLPIILTWAVAARFSRLWAVPAAVAVAAVLIGLHVEFDGGGLRWWTPPVWVTPQFNIAAAVGIALPLFIVTMAGQNITGIAALRSFGYRPPAGPLFAWSGAFSFLAAPFGGHAGNLAAITMAMCAGADAHPDPARRWPASVVAGASLMVCGLVASAAVTFISLAPPILIASVAGLALLGALATALAGALEAARDRESALITLLVTASGVTLFGVGGVFWGLLAGGALYWWEHRRDGGPGDGAGDVRGDGGGDGAGAANTSDSAGDGEVTGNATGDK